MAGWADEARRLHGDDPRRAEPAFGDRSVGRAPTIAPSGSWVCRRREPPGDPSAYPAGSAAMTSASPASARGASKSRTWGPITW